jgi:hypothetical protein
LRSSADMTLRWCPLSADATIAHIDAALDLDRRDPV